MDPYKKSYFISQSVDPYSNLNQHNFASPSSFRKNLPVIYQIQSSPHKQFVSQQIDYLQEKYESRLIQEESIGESMTDWTIPNDSQLLNGKQRKLVRKIYQKQKQLVILQDRMYQLKNCNQCLRETISEIKDQKNQLYEQIEKLKSREIELMQQNEILSDKIVRLENEVNQQKRFFGEENQKDEPNKGMDGLYKEIQSLKEFYEQQIYCMLNRNQDNIKYLEDKNIELEQNMSGLKQKLIEMNTQLNQTKNQKKELLQYYLTVIDQMNKEIQLLRSFPIEENASFDNLYHNLTLNEHPPLGYIQKSQNLSFYQHAQSFHQSSNLNKKLFNQWVSELVQRQLLKKLQKDDQDNEKEKSLSKNSSLSSLKKNFTIKQDNLNMAIINLNTTRNQYKQKKMAIAVTKQASINQRSSLSTKSMDKISKSKQKSITFGERLSRRPQVSKPIMSSMNNWRLMSNYQFTARKTNMNRQRQKYVAIDKKLQDLKQRLTREILRE